MLNNKKLFIKASLPLILGISTIQVHATTYVTDIDPAIYGKIGTITFDDWGFTGPSGRTAFDFNPVNGFNFDSIGQIQHVVTRDADWLTPDAPVDHRPDLLGGDWYGGSNSDAAVSFYKWLYTTKGGSRFNNMLIDTDGDYFIAQEDMNFLLYDTIVHNGTLPADDPKYHEDGTFYTNIAFQPYVLSDAKGWCGSISATNPGALEPMAGQVTFDFAFDVYFQMSPGVYNYSSTEIVRGFEMRSYGTISINLADPGGNLDGRAAQKMSASAVVNNTSPDPALHTTYVDGAPTDPGQYNLVSFMGGGVLEKTVGQCGILNPDWVGGKGLTSTSIRKYTGLMDEADEASCTAAGGTWQTHSYGGYGYILRADGIRVIEAMDYATYSDLTNVPNVIGDFAYNNDENGVLQPIANLSDVDGDGFDDFSDNCPVTPNPGQEDNGGLDTTTPDGVGDACQCGDLSGDGKITNTDSTLIRINMFGIPISYDADFCDVNGDGQCTNTDAVLIQRSLLGLPDR